MENGTVSLEQAFQAVLPKVQRALHTTGLNSLSIARLTTAGDQTKGQLRPFIRAWLFYANHPSLPVAKRCQECRQQAADALRHMAGDRLHPGWTPEDVLTMVEKLCLGQDASQSTAEQTTQV